MLAAANRSRSIAYSLLPGLVSAEDRTAAAFPEAVHGAEACRAEPDEVIREQRDPGLVGGQRSTDGRREGRRLLAAVRRVVDRGEVGLRWSHRIPDHEGAARSQVSVHVTVQCGLTLVAQVVQRLRRDDGFEG